MKKLLTLCLSLTLMMSAWSQNSCETALEVQLGNYSIPVIDGSIASSSCPFGQLANNAEWYSFTPTQDIAVLLFSTSPGSPDTRLFVFSGTCDNLVCEGFDDDSGSSLLSLLTIQLTANTTYYIVWDSFWTNTGFSWGMIETTIPSALVEFDFESSPFPSNNNNGTNLDDIILAGADFNGDNLDDLIRVVDENIDIALQQENGTFTVQTYSVGNIQHEPDWSLTTGDLNQDGLQDIICGGSEGVSILFSSTQSNTFTEFTPGVFIFSQRGNCIDINNDGLLDVFMCHDIAPNLHFINNGNGQFTTISGGLGDTPDGGNYGSIWTDYDNDCDMDLFIAKCRGGGEFTLASRNELHRNNGDGTFTDVSLESGLADFVQTWSAAWADYDNDGDMDVVVGASSFISGHHKVMRNNGDGTFSDITEGSGWDLFNGTGIEFVPADFNNDGFVDVLGALNSIAINNGDFTFTHITSPVGSGNLGDFNNDGFIDIASGGALYINEGNENNFIKVATVGTESNIDGIGARVTIFTASGNQIREVRSGEGFRFMSTNTAHFGLGDETTVSKIEICWPSGIMDEILNPDINTTITVTEGQNTVTVKETAEKRPQLFPNPTQEMIFFRDAEAFINGRFELFNQSGQLVMADVFRGAPISLAAFPSGVYYIKFLNGTKIAGEKLVKE